MLCMIEFERPNDNGDFEEDEFVRICDIADKHLQVHRLETRFVYLLASRGK